MTTTMKPRTDVYSRVTAKIVAALVRGVRSWQNPWTADHAAVRITRPLRATGQPYHGINVLLLWCEALDKGYDASIWMTYKQAATLGAQVRKGEHALRREGCRGRVPATTGPAAVRARQWGRRR